MSDERRAASGEEVRSYRDLKVWQRAMDWAVEVYDLTGAWPREEQFGLTSQVRRCAVSVAANVAEGASRPSTADFLRFLGIARGSLAEAETQLLLAQRLGYTTADRTGSLLAQADEISRMLAGLIASLKARQ